jgi:glycosyltransferase involved in cell wall biosynthesis
MTKTLLWWGRSDRQYSRNRILLEAFPGLGWRVEFFHPRSSRFGLIESYFRNLKSPDAIWVPCFRHTDIPAASHRAKKWKVPLIIDPLISAYQKEVFEKRRYSPDSAGGRRIKKREARLFSSADRIVCDTPSHAAYFQEEFRIDPRCLCTLYVGAEDSLFRPLPAPPDDGVFEVLFYGSFLPLQGPEIIVRAAEMTRDEPIVWTLLGDGDLKSACQRRARGLEKVRFEPWIEYSLLPARLSKARVILGIFGGTPKADLVIPNKVFQAMAAGRPLITRSARAYENSIQASAAIGWVPPGNPEALALIVKKWFRDPSGLAGRGKAIRQLYETYFDRRQRTERLSEILNDALESKNG